jgi:PleD family two-component response regulator
MEEDLQAVDPREALLRAKVEHYLRRAEEYAGMARFASALRAVESALLLDPRNKPCISLRRSMQEQLERLRHRNNGVNGSNGTNGRNGSAASGGSHEAVSHRKSHPELVLIVDQDEQLLTSLTASLRRSGFDTLSAGTYEEAVEMLTVIRPDLVISEVNFETGPRGFELYHWLRSRAVNAGIPFMFLAARLDRDLLIAGKRFGVDDFILKPVDDGVVIASIQNCLSRRRALSHQA